VLVAEMQHSPSRDVAQKVSVTIDVLEAGHTVEPRSDHGEGAPSGHENDVVASDVDGEVSSSSQDAGAGQPLGTGGRCFAGGAGAACLGGWDEEGSAADPGEGATSAREVQPEPSVTIVSPVVSQVFEYVEEVGGSWGALVNVAVRVDNFDVGPGGGTVVVCLNDRSIFRSSQATVDLKIGGLGLGSHVVTVSLFDAKGHLVRGPPLKEDGHGSVLGMYPDTDAADCYSAFKVDRRVWGSLANDTEALYRGEYAPRIFDVNCDAPGSLPPAASPPVRMNLQGVYVWEELASAYRDFHRAALRGPPGRVPLYVYTPRDCGWGNRLIDLASAYQVPRHTASCLLPPASCFLPPASCLLPPASCLLPTASCLLPVAYYLLPPAYCLLTARFLLPLPMHTAKH